MPTRTLATLTLLFLLPFVSSTVVSEPVRSPAAHPERPRQARVVDDVEGCRVPPPSPEPVAPTSCDEVQR